MRRMLRKWWDALTISTSSTISLKTKSRWAPRLEALEDRLAPAGGALNPLPPGVISGLVFVDTNGNGVRNSNERPLQGVQITLSGATQQGTAVRQSTVTDSSGVFSFLQV